MAEVNDLDDGQPYEYDALPSARSIRLIELISHTRGSSDFEGRFHVVGLDGAHLFRYVALSYAWKLPDIKGAELIQRPTNPGVLINGRKIPISETLFDLFDQNWSDDEDEGLAWIDAICINQANVTERNEQVEIMQEIYRGAYLVCVWLGLEDDDSRTSVPIVQSFVAADLELKMWEQAIPAFQPFSEASHYEAVGLPFVSADDWKAIRAFFSRGWFHRVWTVQEIALAQDAVLICGQTTMDWSDITTFIVTVMSTGLMSKLYFDRQRSLDTGMSATNTLFGSDDVLLMKAIFHARDEPISKPDSTSAGLLRVFRYLDGDGFVVAKLAWCLSLSRRRASSDARDRIHAMRNLATKYHKPLDWQRLKPDYRKDSDTAFTETTYYIIEKLGNLSFLSFVENRSDDATSLLPSWVPDFTRISTSISLLMYGNYECLRGSKINGDADGKISSVALRQGNLLITRGIVLAGIQDVSTPCAAAVERSKISPLIEFMSSMHNTLPSGGSRGEALMKTLTSGRGNNVVFPGDDMDSGDFESLRDSFRMFVLLQISIEISNWMRNSKASYDVWWNQHNLLETFCNQDQYLPSRSEIDDYFAALQSVRTDVDRAKNQYVHENLDMHEQFFVPQQSYSEIIRLALPGRKLFRTTNKNIGLVPLAARPGDEIWMLLGSLVPFVLRRRSDRSFVFLGEAYVHGFMHGEAFQRNPALCNQVQDVILR